ncbi:alpha/beta fold hydrolase [Salinactinospora qingdaonensis]|uniref:Alpha/beta fold hydrolase n=1 Tax=Salinactinospora qingdaonensis TaxID=702744 RepID=A0ABP7FFK3_9ACTN
MVGALAEHHDVVNVDLPGFGGSRTPAPGVRLDIPTLVDVVTSLCASLGLERPHVAGNSLGGALALELGARGATASVTVFSPVGFSTPLERAAPRLLLRGAGVAGRVPPHVRAAVADSQPARALAKRVLRGGSSDGSGDTPRFDADALEAGSAFVRLAPEVLDYEFPAVDVPCPVTIGWGERDRVLPARAARRALERIPHARHVSLPNCGHTPMAEAPEEVAAAILRTCGSLPEPHPAPTEQPEPGEDGSPSAAR